MSNSTSPADLPTQGGFVGQAWQLTGGSAFNNVSFLIQRILAGKAFAALVQVKSITAGNGALALAGSVDVQPMVDQIDGLGNQMPHGTIYSLPYFRAQGGVSGIICDPAVGDIGVAIFADRDISKVKATRAIAGPGSRRQNDWADGLYIGGFLNAVPTQYVRFHELGIDIVTTGTLMINAGTIASTGTLLNNGLHVGSTHVHGGVQSGGSNTGTPVT